MLTTLAIRTRRTATTLALALSAGVMLAPVHRAQAQQDTSFAVARDAVVDVTVRGGRVVVRGTDGNTGTVRGGDGQYRLRSTGVGVSLTNRDNDSDIDGRRDMRVRARDRDNGDAPLMLELPRNVRLVLSTLSADVDVSDISGSVEVRTRSGEITLENIGGRLIVETISGTVRLSNVAGAARVNTVSGDVVMRGVREEVRVNTTSGDLRMVLDRATRIEAQSVSGDVRVEGQLMPDAQLQVITHSGDIVLRGSDDIRGTLQFSTFNGELSAGSRLVMLPGSDTASRRERASQRYQLGSGGAMRLVLSTFSGDVVITRSAQP